MKKLIGCYGILFLWGCGSVPLPAVIQSAERLPPKTITSSKKFNPDSWPYFLQHLPETDSPILDYEGNPVPFQEKHVAIIPYDVGTRDLQQCADALMRLRAEYLYAQKQYDKIGFHFVSGQYYPWSDYCKGLRPIVRGNSVNFINTSSCKYTHETLRNYLNIVYNYASTISLAKELKKTTEFEVGTVIICPGSPGHCFIITDEAINAEGEKVFKLVEGYTPAQSIYVLRNLQEKEISPWYPLKKGIITTSSCRFINYQMGKFE